VKTGDLKRLRIDPQPGFPESFEMSCAIKITKERIMVRGEIYDPNMEKSLPPKPRPRPAPKPAAPAKQDDKSDALQPAADAPQSAASATPAPAKKSSVGPATFVPRKAPAPEPEPPAVQTPRVDAVRMQLLADELRKDLRGEIRDLAETVIKDGLRESMQELSRMLLDRINALETSDKLEKTRQGIVSDLKDLLSEKPDSDAPDVEQIIEEKLKRLVVNPLQSAEARTTALEQTIQKLAARQEEISSDMAHKVQNTLEQINTAFAETDQKSAADLASAITALKESVSGLGQTLAADLQGIKAGAVTRDQLGGMLDVQREKFQERANDLRQSFIDDVRELAVSIIEERLRAMGDRVSTDMDAFREEISGVPASVKDAVKQFQTRAAAFDTRLESAGDIARTLESLKSELAASLDKAATAQAEKVDAALKEFLAAAQKREPDPALCEMQESAKALRDNLETMRGDINAQLTRTFEKLSQDWELDRDSSAGFHEAIQAALDALPARFDALAGVVSDNSPAPQLNTLGGLPAQLQTLREQLQEIAGQMQSSISAAAGSLADTVQAQPDALANRVRELLAPVLEALAAAGDISQIQELMESSMARMEQSLAPVVESLAAAGDTSQIQEFLDNSVDRLEQGLAAVRHDFTGGSEGRGGLFMQQLDRIDATVGNHVEKLSVQQAETLSRLDALGADTRSRFDGILSTLDDSLRREIAKYDDSAAARAGELKDTFKKAREQFTELITSLGGDKLDSLKTDLLDEIRTYSEAAVKSEDLVKTREWLESTVESLMKTMTREAEEKIGRALTQLSRFQEEVSMDTGQFRHDVQELRTHMAASLEERLSAALDDLQQRLNIEQVREAVLAHIAETADKTTQAARSDSDHLQDLIRNILLAVEEARENELDPAALQHGIESLIGERLQGVVERLEQQVAGGAGQAVAAAASLEQKLTKRDAGIRKTLETIEEALEKLLKRGPGLGLGDMFGGGLMNIFGGRTESEPEPAGQVDETRRIGDTAVRPTRQRKRPGPSGAVEAAQVRRLSYLVGKTVTRAIEDKDGNLIADQGDIVDEDMICVARDTHKVLDLIRAVDLSRR